MVYSSLGFPIFSILRVLAIYTCICIHVRMSTALVLRHMSLYAHNFMVCIHTQARRLVEIPPQAKAKENIVASLTSSVSAKKRLPFQMFGRILARSAAILAFFALF